MNIYDNKRKPDNNTNTAGSGTLFDHFIVAVSLPDGRICATLASLCDALGLAQNSQARRIRMMMC